MDWSTLRNSMAWYAFKKSFIVWFFAVVVVWMIALFAADPTLDPPPDRQPGPVPEHAHVPVKLLPKTASTPAEQAVSTPPDRKSTRLNSSHRH